MNLVPILLLFALGAGTGIAAGYLGIGGGIILVPVLSELFRARGMDIDVVMTTTFATSLSTAVFTTGAAAWRQWKQDNLIIKAVPWVAGGALLGGQLGSYLGSHLSGEVLKSLFGLFLLLSGVYMAIEKERAAGQTTNHANCWILLSLGVVTGVIAALLGVGGGIVMVPVFIILLRFPPGKVAGTSSAVACLTAVSAVIGYLLYGGARETGATGFWGVIDLTTAIPIAAGTLITAQLGARLNKRFGGKSYRRVFGAFIVLVGIRMIAS